MIQAFSQKPIICIQKKERRMKERKTSQWNRASVDKSQIITYCVMQPMNTLFTLFSQKIFLLPRFFQYRFQYTRTLFILFKDGMTISDIEIFLNWKSFLNSCYFWYGLCDLEINKFPKIFQIYSFIYAFTSFPIYKLSLKLSKLKAIEVVCQKGTVSTV